MNSGLPIPMAQGMRSMPATSKKQFKFMHAVASGAIKKAGLSPAKAKEFVSGQSPKGLPERKRRHRVKYPSPSKK